MSTRVCPQCRGIGIEDITSTRCRMCGGDGIVACCKQKEVTKNDKVNKEAVVQDKTLKVASISVISRQTRTASRNVFDEDEDTLEGNKPEGSDVTETMGDLPQKPDDEVAYRKKLISGILSFIMNGNSSKIDAAYTAILSTLGETPANDVQDKPAIIFNKLQTLPLEIVERVYLMMRN